ncbi:hypothetical protein ANO14919_030990 [Xylariales sp. No.14919]|nr:hypothetical protein ANO14919_030990 [Xylariales sp. No.14919]
MSEEKLRRILLLHRFQSRVFEIIERQRLIPYHCHLLKLGDLKAREDFRFIQKCYTRALGLPMAEIRRYIELVDVDELKGFSVQLIKRPFDMDEYEESGESPDDVNNAIDEPNPYSEDHRGEDGDDGNMSSQRPESPQPPIEEGPQSEAELMDLCDQDIMTRFGFKSVQELQKYLEENVSTYSPPDSATPIDAPAIQGAQQNEVDAAEYDENGFFVGGYDRDENEEIADRDEEQDTEDYDGDTDMRGDGEDSDDDKITRENGQEGDGTVEAFDETTPLESNSSLVSSASEVGVAIENGTGSRSSTPSEPSSLQDSDTSCSELFSPDPTPCHSDSSSSTGGARQNRRLSEELRRLLVRVGGDPNTTRSEKVVSPLLQYEMDVVERKWNAMVAELKRREDRGALARHDESWEETDLLDDWDAKHCQFYWQTEGLFLCRLTEVVYKEIFKQARTVYWAERRSVRPKRKRGWRNGKQPGTPLRREFT